MQRPYLSKTFKELEALVDRAIRGRDAEMLALLQVELGHRDKNSKLPQLRDKVLTAIGKSQPRQTDLFDIKSGKSGVRTPRQAATPQKTAGSVTHSKPRNAKRPKFRPTDEQVAALDAFLSGRSLKINAFAGTGKTSTLQLLANATTARGQYLAFNKDIVTDASEKFPDTVDCSTSHRLAFRAAPSGYKKHMGKLTDRCTANHLVEALDLKKRTFGEKHPLTAEAQGYLYLETIRRYAQSADDEIGSQHVPQLGALRAAKEEVVAEVRQVALDGARMVWGRMLSENDDLPLGHDGYLKLWGLSRPVIAADYILLDEAQDTNPVVLDVLERQRAQLVYVGDRYQQIYEWRGAVNAMEKIETDASAFLTTSFRFGDGIADAATKLLAMLGEDRAVRGNPALRSRIGPANPDAVLARTNASTITAVIEALDAKRRPHLVGGRDELMKMLRGVQSLKEGEPSEHPDFFGFKNWAEVVEFAKRDEGAYLVTFVNLVETRGERQLMWALNRTVGEDSADLVVSTGHRSKGREWKSVRLMDDFLRSSPADEKGNSVDPAELRLLYVALTRAKENLEVPEPILRFIERGVLPQRERLQPQKREISQPARAIAIDTVKPVQPSRPAPNTPKVERSATGTKPRKGILGWLFGK